MSESRKPRKPLAKGAAVVKSAPSWVERLLASAKAVGSTAKKMDFYRQARRDAPGALAAALEEQELLLDGLVRSLLDERPNLKGDVLADERFDASALREIEVSYQKAVCYAPGKERAHSRMFFLPCVYWSRADGSPDGVLDFTAAKGVTFSEFACAFLDEHFGEGQDQSPKVRLYAGSLLDWNVQDEEERMLPAMHRALLAGSTIDLDQAFPFRAKALAESSGDESGWSIAVLPFAVEHDDEAWLESISFEGYEDDFLEGFEEIFDPGSKLDYSCPCDPTMIKDESVRALWMKQLELTTQEITATKRGRQIGVVEVTFHWDGQEPVGVVMDFKIVDHDAIRQGAGEEEEDDGVRYHKQISRQTLVGETPADLAGFLAEYPPLVREDFDLIIGHMFESGGD